MLDFTYYYDKILSHYNVQTLKDLSEVTDIPISTMSSIKQRKSISGLKKKCRELGIFDDIFVNPNLQNIISNSGQVAQNVKGSQNFGNESNQLNLDEDILTVLKSAAPLINPDNKESFKQHIKKWIVENL